MQQTKNYLQKLGANLYCCDISSCLLQITLKGYNTIINLILLYNNEAISDQCYNKYNKTHVAITTYNYCKIFHAIPATIKISNCRIIKIKIIIFILNNRVVTFCSLINFIYFVDTHFFLNKLIKSYFCVLFLAALPRSHRGVTHKLKLYL